MKIRFTALGEILPISGSPEAIILAVTPLEMRVRPPEIFRWRSQTRAFTREPMNISDVAVMPTPF